MFFNIKRKYNYHYAERNVINAKIRWYGLKRDWPELAKYNIEKINKYGLDTAGFGKFILNNMIWNVFVLHINDQKMLMKGLQWEEIIIRSNPSDLPAIDTYANLLYKIGKTQEAIKFEEMVANLEENEALKNKRRLDSEFRETLDKMIQGKLTWKNE
jgi:hypothetical protein